MKKLLLNFLLFSSLLVGCSDYQLNKFIERSPEIEVTPTDHDCGHLLSGKEKEEFSVNVSNVGNEELKIRSVFLENNNSNFTIMSSLPDEILPSETHTIVLKYEPKTYESNTEKLSIVSNDVDDS